MKNDNFSFWDERYSQSEYVYGEKANEYLKEKLAGLNPGKILFVAEGEGRNAVFAATSGWDVFAFDPSKEGKRKAEQLALKNKVSLHYITTDVENVQYPENNFDAIALIFAHFHQNNRRAYHKKLTTFLKKGGVLILEAFSKKHIQNQQANPYAGGPKDANMLYDLEELKNDFAGFNFVEATESVTELREGNYHKGRADVVRILAIKQ